MTDRSFSFTGRITPVESPQSNRPSQSLCALRLPSDCMEPIALTRRERERLRRRDEMLAAAKSVIADRGYARATLDEIAQRAESGKGTLYNYFHGGKKEILYAIFDELYDDLQQIIERSLSDEKVRGDDLRGTFRQCLFDVFVYFEKRQDLFMILIREAHRMMFDTPQSASFFLERRRRLANALSSALAVAMESGRIRTMPAEPLAQMILGNIRGCQMYAQLADGTNCETDAAGVGSPHERADFLTSVLFDGLRVN